MVILFMVAAIVTVSLNVLVIVAMFGLKISRRFARGREARFQKRIRRTLSELDGLDVDRRIAIARLSALRPFQLFKALDIASADFGPAAVAGVLEAARAKKLDETMAHRLRHARRKWTRIQAAYALAPFGDAIADSLVEAMHSSDVDVAFNAAQALSLVRTERSFDLLLHHLTDLNQFSQTRIAHLLEGYVETGFGILRTTCSSRDANLRYWTAYLLGRARDKEALSLLLNLTDDENDDVRAGAAEALGPLGRGEAEGKLVELLSDKTWFVRNHAIKSLKELGLASTAGLIAPLLRDRNWWVRQNATEALISFGDKALRYVLEMLDDEDRFARNRAAEILGRLGVVDRRVGELTGKPVKDRPSIDFLRKVYAAGATQTLRKYLSGPDRMRKRKVREVTRG